MPKPKLNRRAPQFTAEAIVDGEIVTVSLSDYIGRYVVLVFYPLDFTFTSPTEVIAYSEATAQFERLRADVVAISCDSVYAHLAWTKMPRSEGGIGAVNIPLVSDKTAKIARSYGVFNETTGIPYRGVFIIDERQMIRQCTINDLTTGRSVHETLRLVQALRKSDETGEECPINWVPGMRTVTPDPHECKKYFQATYAVQL